MPKIKTRFAPSPTGYLHIGGARTALFNVLLARHSQGEFLLRIEDTDEERSLEAYTQALMVDLRWLNCDWQEGADIGGPHGPYWQSQRRAIYEEYYAKLQAQGLAYPCFCSEEQLALSRKLQRVSGKAPRYAGTCRGLSPEKIAEKIAQGCQPALRFNIASQGVIEFDDMVKGKQIFQADDIGDFIIRRADGGSAFMFANAIDDALMGITHLLRGEDHLTNTPRQLAIARALGLREPRYGHISLILGQDGAPLSKRNGSMGIQDLRDMGYFPSAVLNYLARLGHYYADNTLYDIAGLAAAFTETGLSKSPARFDEQQLRFWQKEAVLHADSETFWQWLTPTTRELIPADKKTLFIQTMQTNVLFPQEAEHWATILFAELIFNDEARTILSATDPKVFVVASEAVTKFATDFKAIANTVKEQTGVKGKDLFQPLRVALTGELHGPELGNITELLGVEKLTQRFNIKL